MRIDASILMVVARVTTPILLCAIGGLFCQIGGTPNITLEGAMLSATFAAVCGSYFTQIPLVAVLFAILGSLIINLIFGFIHLKLKGEPTITGFAINSLSLGLTTYLLRTIFDVTGTLNDSRIVGLSKFSIPLLKDIPVLGYLFDNQTVCVYLSWVFIVLAIIVIYRTQYGMKVRACGENPAAAAAMGVSVDRIRWSCVMISAVMSGLAGAQLSLGNLSMFSENMTSGRGFIALAAIMLSGGRPLAMFITTVLFGFAEALSNQAQLGSVSSHLVLMLPYLVVIAVLLLQPEQVRTVRNTIRGYLGSRKGDIR
jgi:ABC-type uncharacterized transport system permease subunit